jgi:hypothetical protein
VVEPAVGKNKKFRMIMRNFACENWNGSDGLRTRAGLVLILAFDDLINRTMVGIVAKHIA